MRQMVIYAVSLITALVISGCSSPYDHEYKCEVETIVYFNYVDQNGEQTWSQQYKTFASGSLKIYDPQTGAKLHNHSHKLMRNLIPGYDDYYLSPDICRRTFPSVRVLMTSYFDEKKEGGKRYVQIDTIDVELHYLDFDKCNITSYSLNGVPQWRRDTCQTDYSRTMRFCNLVVDPERFIEKE